MPKDNQKIADASFWLMIGEETVERERSVTLLDQEKRGNPSKAFT